MKYLILGVILSITHTAYGNSSKCQRALEENDYDMVPLCLQIDKLRKRLKEAEQENELLKMDRENREKPRECPKIQEVTDVSTENTQEKKVHPVTQANIAYLNCMAHKWYKDPKTDCSAALKEAKRVGQNWGF